ncbi:transcriptional regulator [Amycolatopsis marina]|uniref:Transcriptional regulator n=1 Tax=Amycolatopsis marina TaxID=490629 RepID=A0A1I0ZSB5_9PSEU|nr:LuxR family transcriptional regulator [Amycolatopsis marina]SFB28634.1 transcriptional regulator [Amycolatopsis marina]
MARDWPLAGRDEELRFIAAAMRPATGTAGLVLAGAAGVGKTRLAREALALAGERGAAVHWVLGTASAGAMPLGAFAGVLDVHGDPARLVRRAVETLAPSPESGPVVVGVDDAHLLDDLSAMAVHQLVVRSAATVVLTLRTGEPAPDAVTALWKDEHLQRLEIQPLSEAETAALLEAVLGGPVDSGSAGRLWSLTGGNALFLRHLVDGELEAGRLGRIQEVWRWSDSPAISAELAEIVRRQMGELPGRMHDVVDLLAVGEPLDIGLLTGLTDGQAVEEAEARRLVRTDIDGRRFQARLAHPLYGEVRRGEMGLVRARRLRGLIATALADDGRNPDGPDGVVRRAVLALDSDLEPDPALFVAAAHHAIRLFDLALGERLARAAVVAGGEFDAKLTLAYALSWLSKGVEAEQILSELDAAACGAGARARVAIPRAANLFWTLGRATEAEAVLNTAASEAHDEHGLAPLAAVRAAFDAALGRPRPALDAGMRVLASSPTNDQTVIMAACAVVAAAAVMGRIDDVRRTAPVGYRAAARSFDAGVMSFGLGDFHILALRLSGDLREIEQVARDRRMHSADVPGPAYLMGLVLLGQAALATGQVRTAARWLREARAGLTSVAAHEFRFRCRLHLTQALAMAGNAVAARAVLAELEAERHPAYTLLEPDTLLARAWVAAAEGATTEATAAARGAAALALDRGAPAYEMFALQTAVFFGDRTVAGRLAELATVVRGPRSPAAAAHAAALAEHDGDALMSVSARWEQMGDPLAAAEAAAQAVGAYSRRGLRGSANTAAGRAHHLASICEGARTPNLVAAARPLPLTGREREIVTLVAQGLSNREIAARLVVSVRTVEGHLYRVGNKLGVNDRGEFAALLHGE